MTRRTLLALGAAGALPLRPATTGRVVKKRGMIVRSARPEDLEMPLEGFRDFITPADRLFVRSHHYVPAVDAASWRLAVAAEVRSPVSLTLDELKRMPRAELTGVLECAGNGRGFFHPSMPGIQWEYGGVGNARWSGVRLKDVLERAGVKTAGRHVVFSGADQPVGTQPKFERSIPLERALDPNTLLAFDINGEPLPAQHGFPLRLVVPGWASDSSVKWISKIDVRDREADGFYMKTAYRYPGKSVTPGTAVPPEQMVPVTNLAVKSIIHTPGPTEFIRQGAPVKIAGVAWASGPVEGVDVSVDFEGKKWAPATLGRQEGPYSWREWSYTTVLPAKHQYIRARARTASGEIQPLEPPWNPSGYLWNQVQSAGVVHEFPPGYREACHACHGEDIIEQQGLTPAQWEREVDKMIRWGAQVKPGNRKSILDYLNTYYGGRPMD